MGVWDYVKKGLDPGGLFFDAGGPKQPAGVGGPAQNPSRLVQDPATGMFYDPQTGTTYSDAAGNQPVTDPNVAQQVASNFSARSNFLNQLSGTQAQQNALAQHLNNLVMGNAPTVAGMQSAQALNQIAAQQNANAAGVGGASAPLAQLMAGRNTGQAQIGALNAGTMGAVAEKAQAANQLGGLLNAMAGQNLQGAQGFGQMAEGGQESQQGLGQAADIANAQNRQRLLVGAGAALNGIGSKGGGAAAAA